MFDRLLDFSYKRTPLQAVGFYVAYMFFFMLIVRFTAYTIGSFTNNLTNEALSIKIALFSSTVISFLMTVRMIYEKKLAKNIWYVYLTIAAAFIGLLGGTLLGLIPSAYLSTKNIGKIK
jgi:hypothetical protein